MFLTDTLQEISNLKPQNLRGHIGNFFPLYMFRRDYKHLKRVIFEHNSIILAISDYLFSPLPKLEKLVETSKLKYLLTPSLKRPFYLKGVATIEDIRHHTPLYEAMCEL